MSNNVDHLLTPEELAILNEKDDDETEHELIDDNPPVDDDVTPEETPPKETPPKETPEATPPKEDSDKKAADDDSVLTATELDELEAEIDKQFEDGELSNADYREQMKMLNAQRASLIRQEAKAEAEQKTLAQQWETAQQEFFAAEDNKIFSENEDLYTALDARIRKMGADNPSWSGKKLLEEAAKVVKASFGLKSTKPTRSQPSMDTPSLSNVPAAGVEDPRSGEFAYLDRLQGEALEKALNKLSPDKLQRYLESEA
jgi:hypothetical protein